jgi:hypothetical protein
MRLTDRIIFQAVGLWGWVAHPRVMLFYLRSSLRVGRLPHLGLPQTANDKFLWRKLFDHDPEFTRISDKIALKDWARARFPEVATAPLLWVGTDPHSIPAQVLEGNVVVKANHGCGMNRIIRQGVHDRQALVAEACGWLATDHGRRRLEWGYLNIRRQLLVETLMVEATTPVQELKYYCFGSRILRLVQIVGRNEADLAARIHEADADGILRRTDIPAEVTPRLYSGGLPATAARAQELARRLGAGFDHVRVDFLTNGVDLWLGEMTLYNLAGRLTRGGTDPNHASTRAWDLRQTWFLSHPPRRGWRALYARALARALGA